MILMSVVSPEQGELWQGTDPAEAVEVWQAHPDALLLELRSWGWQPAVIRVHKGM
jgi:hypothetical protein